MAFSERFRLAGEALSAGLYCLIYGNLHERITEENLARVKSGGDPGSDPRIDKLPRILRKAVLGRITLEWSTGLIERTGIELNSLRANDDMLRMKYEGLEAGMNKHQEDLSVMQTDLGRLSEAIDKTARDLRVVENQPIYIDDQRN